MPSAGFETRDHSNRAVAGLCLTLHDHRKWQLNYLVVKCYVNGERKRCRYFFNFSAVTVSDVFQGGQIRMLLVQCGRSFGGFRLSQTESDGVVWGVE